MPPPSVFLLIVTLTYLPDPALLVQVISFDLVEEQDVNVAVGSITDCLELDEEKTDDLLASLRYSFLPHGYPHSSLFRITDGKGEIFAVERIDREEICGFAMSCSLKLELVVQSSTLQLFKKVRVIVVVIDVNDNAPTFPSTSVALDISESVSVNSSFAVEGAIDPDTGRNALQTYDILRADGVFDLDIKKNLDGGSVVNLIVRETLDRERRDFYRIYLMAKDGGIPRKSSLLMVNITVTDINDNAPEFAFAQYNATVKEVVSIGHVVLRITASDADASISWRPFYRISPLQSGEARKFFNMNPRTGEITVISSLSEIQGRKLKFVVECVDGDTPPLVGQSEVEIFVQDTENTEPVINLNLLNSGMVSESHKLGTVVAHLAASDPDSGRNGYVKCSIVSSTFAIQNLDVSEYKVTLKRFLDRESEGEVGGIITCQDEGEPPLNITESFTMTVLDENDNKPTFTKEVYEVTIEENNQPNVTLLQVTALDSDYGDNGKVHYSIIEGRNSGVTISQQGEITALLSFDREDKVQIPLTILAQDNGTPSLNSTATVVINLQDVNDVAPTFSQSIYSFEIPENTPRGTQVGKVSVYDLDDGRNGEVFLSIELLFEDIESFPISVTQTGELKTTRPLDRERENHFEFAILATDKGREPITSTAKIFVDVNDKNDNVPVLFFPSAMNDTISVAYNTDPGTVVMNIDAIDNDAGDNGKLEYVLTSIERVEIRLEDVEFDDQTEEELFSLDPETGEITLFRYPTLDDLGVYSLNVMVRDHGTVSLSTNTTLILEIAASNETIVALLTGTAESNNNTTIVTALGCLTGLVIVVVVVIIFTVRMVDRERTLKRQQQLHVKVEPRDGDLKYDGEILESGHKLKRSLSSPRLSSQVSHGWKFLSAWHLGSGDSNKLAAAHNWARNKEQEELDMKVFSRKEALQYKVNLFDRWGIIALEKTELNISCLVIGAGIPSLSPKSLWGFYSPGNNSPFKGEPLNPFKGRSPFLEALCSGNSTDRKLLPTDDNTPEPEYSVVIRPNKEKFDCMQSRRLLPKLDEISLPSDELYADYCSLDTIKEEPESPYRETDFHFEPPVPKLRQPKKLPRNIGILKDNEGQGLIRAKSRNDLRMPGDSSDEETLKRASVDSVNLKCGDSVIFDLDLQKVDDIFV
ncbi:protocadherin-11 X-linked-like [Haliotis asinina]|uniref:protocadherin-11 X-linked-like n=1 Tax=Haliotis asinina TaxID=109174 RepID=UPI003531AC44